METNGFDNYTDLKVEDKGINPIDIDDIDTSSLKDQEKIRYRQDTKFRKHLTLWVMIIIPSWLILVFILLCLCAFRLCELSNAILTTLLATTTANILGLANIVLKGMFLKDNNKKTSKG